MSSRSVAALVPVFIAVWSLVIAAQAPAPTVSGTWTGKFVMTVDENPPNESTAHLVLKQTGAEVTGTAGPTADEQHAISKGKIATVKDVTTLTFDVVTDGGPILQFELKLVEGRLKGTAKAEFDGRKARAELDLERAK